MALTYDLALQLAQLSGQVLTQPDLTVALEHVTGASVALMPGCDGASLTMRREGVPVCAASSDDWARTLDETQYVEQEGPCLNCLRTGAVMRVRDLADDGRFPMYGPRAAAQGARSVTSLPLAADGRTVGALNLYGRSVDTFDGEALALGELLGAHAALAVQASTAFFSSKTLADQLREAMSSRAVIEQAKGIVMARDGCDAVRAFEVLTSSSQTANIKLRQVAEQLVASVCAPSRGPAVA